ncbi:MAG: hypothetical protein AB7L17_16060 [Ilumatobacteraceae bacterium]
MTVWDAFGHGERITTIPSTSVFGRYGGGRTATCTFTAPHDDYRLPDGRIVPQGTEITSNYVFYEGVNTVLDRSLPNDADGRLGVVTRGPLSTATRWFTVYCETGHNDLSSIGYIPVPLLDPVLDPRPRVDELRNELDLERPVVFTNPIVDRFGGLVTRYPTWLAIEPSAWRPQTSPRTEVYRGLRLWLTADPRELDFDVDFTPDPDAPSAAQHVLVPCVPETAADAGDGALPALPVLPEQTEPGPNGSCMWTPPGPGTVTITAQVTYTITFWAEGYSEPDADYVWTSQPATYVTGELTAVNTRP